MDVNLPPVDSAGLGDAYAHGVIPRLDLAADAADLTTALVAVPSVHPGEGPLADAVAAALGECAHLRVDRHGNSVVARTDRSAPLRVIVAGHLDTVPGAPDQRTERTPGSVYGLGAADMKSGVAIALRLAAALTEPVHDLTFIFYDGEEVAERHNGLGALSRVHPEWLTGDLAILMEPSAAGVEAGCQGTAVMEVRLVGVRAHVARWWRGDNAIHRSADVLDAVRGYVPRQPVIDGLGYREALQVVGIAGGVATNVVPDEAVITLNHRFAPDRTLAEAVAHVSAVLEASAPGAAVRLIDGRDGALPGLSSPLIGDFLDAVRVSPRPKLGWTDVARFARLGMPALNYGPGDPQVAHTAQEHVPVRDLHEVESGLRRFLTGEVS